ncbi:MAG: ABC transporter substrate-binding protein [Burkholderia sp.]
MKFRTLLSTVALALGLTSLGAHAADSAPLRVGVNTFAGYGLLYLAQAKGFFQARHVDVKLLSTEDKPSTAAALVSHNLDAWITTVDTFIFYDAKRLGIRQALAISFSNGAEGILATADIRDPKQLKGKTIAVEEGSPAYFLLLNVLASNGLSKNDVKVLNLKGADAGAAFVAGKVDVAATWDPWLGQASKRSGGHVLIDSRATPGLIADTIAFRSDVLTSRRADVTNFIRAYFDADAYWKAHPDESNTIIANAIGIKESDLQSALKSVRFGSRDANADYFLKPDGIARVIDKGERVYRDAGVLKQATPAQDIVDVRPLKDALAQ